MKPSTALVFEDGDFDTADYTLQIVEFSGSGGTGSLVFEGAGGNPGAHLRIATRPPPISGARLFSAAIDEGFVYDPAVRGAIDSIVWRVDTLAEHD